LQRGSCGCAASAGGSPLHLMRRRPSRRLQRCTRRHRYALSASRLSRARAQLGCGAPPCSAPPLPGDAACCGGDLAPPAPEPRTCCGPLDRRFARPEAPGAAWPAAPARCCRCRLCRAGRRFARQLPPAGPEMRKVCCCCCCSSSCWQPVAQIAGARRADPLRLPRAMLMLAPSPLAAECWGLPRLASPAGPGRSFGSRSARSSQVANSDQQAEHGAGLRAVHRCAVSGAAQ
jgi:hypothetical protein